jgi:hypothetical protein
VITLLVDSASHRPSVLCCIETMQLRSGGDNHSFLFFAANVANKLSRIASTRRLLWGRCVARSTTANPTDSECIRFTCSSVASRCRVATKRLRVDPRVKTASYTETEVFIESIRYQATLQNTPGNSRPLNRHCWHGNQGQELEGINRHSLTL